MTRPPASPGTTATACRVAVAGFGLPLALAACAPVPVARAEEDCFHEARLAAAPRGIVAGGFGNGSPVGKVRVDITTDYLQGRDPAEVYNLCVYQKSGQPPSRPLYSRPDWKG